jgi:hypothetical protein
LRWSRGPRFTVAGDDLDQLGLGQPGAVVAQVAQQFGDALVGLRDAGDADGLVVLLHAGDVDAVGQLPHQFVEQVHRQVAVGLQVFHRLLAGAQRGDLFLQGGDVLDLAFELLDLAVSSALLALLARRSAPGTTGR